jgi:hypothetical protein
MRGPCFEEDFGDDLLAFVHGYMEGLYDGLDGPVAPDTITGYAFCGCEVCEERERYIAIMTFTLEGAEAGRVHLEER